MKKILGIFIMMAVLVSACKKQEPTPAQVEEIYFEQSAPTKLDEGDDINLSSYLVISPEAVADTVTVEWNSSDEAIAIVSMSGSVETLRAGEVTITATAMGKTATLNLTIEEIEIDEFTIPETFEVYVGEKAKFPITVKPKGAPLYRFKWEADNNGKEPTYSEGNWYLKADKEREYTLTASVDDVSEAKCVVKFIKPLVDKLVFNPASYTIEEGGSLSLESNLQITPAKDIDANTIKVIWSSSNESVATIDQNGKVQSVAAGKTTITAKAGNKTATCTVEVTAKPTPEDSEKPEDPEKPEDSEKPEDPDGPDTPIDPSDPIIPIVKEYTVSYDANGGNGVMSSVTVKENESITIANNLFTRPVYNFIGWNTKANGSGIDYQSGASLVVTENITLYAQWKDMANGHEYVDLGLSVKWALCNVGASSSIARGDYYAWGETATKSDYSYSTYEQTWKATNIYSSEDVAIKVMGGKWRMPTKTEMEELRDNCTWTWTVAVNGEEGYLVTSKKNGYSIFLPAVGRKIDTNTTEYGERGYYYSSTSPQDVYNRGCGYALIFDNTSQTVAYVSGSQGFSVRAVLP